MKLAEEQPDTVLKLLARVSRLHAELIHHHRVQGLFACQVDAARRQLGTRKMLSESELARLITVRPAVGTPGKTAALRLRAAVAIAVVKRVKSWKVPPAQAAARLGLTQAKLDELLKGRPGAFSLDALTALANRAGLAVTITVRGAGKS
jgi:predicted XRE-type DNA-binding protein